MKATMPLKVSATKLIEITRDARPRVVRKVLRVIECLGAAIDARRAAVGISATELRSRMGRKSLPRISKTINQKQLDAFALALGYPSSAHLIADADSIAATRLGERVRVRDAASRRTQVKSR